MRMLNKLLCKIFGHAWTPPQVPYDPFEQRYWMVCVRCGKNSNKKRV